MRASRPAFVTFGTATLLLVCLGLSLTGAAAANLPAEERRFEELIQLRQGGVIAVAPQKVDDLAPGDPLRRHWNDFRESNSGNWSVYLDERSAMPTLVSGPGVEIIAVADLESVTLSDVETAVRAFLDVNGEILGDWKGLLTLDEDASGELRSGYWQLVFRQKVDSVTIENSRLDFHVVDGKLTLFGSSNWAAPTVNGRPEIDSDEAVALLDTHLGIDTSKLESAGEPRLVLMAMDPAPAGDRPRRWSGARGAGVAHALIWRLSFRDPDGAALWVGEIDAHDGSLRAFYDGAHYAAVRGGVHPVAPDLGCSAEGCEFDGFPMPFVSVTEEGQSAIYADAYGNLTCSDPDATFQTSLSGGYVAIVDNCGAILETGDCSEGLSLGLQAGENCDVAPGSSPGNTAAARSAFYHISRVNEIAQHYIPGLPFLNDQVTVYTNWNQNCNASYGNGSIYVYRSGTSWATCANSGEIQGILVHEWGHGLDENDGGDWDNTSEAYGDVVSMLASRQSCFGPGLFTDGRVCSGYGDTCLTCTGFREHDWAARQGNTPATPQDFVANNCGTGAGPCGGGVHCESYPIDEAIFDLATRDLTASGMDQDSAWQLVERLWYSTRLGSGGDIYTCALPASDSCSASSWYQRMRAADDDDGDLSNGTPHAAALFAAYARHNIACGVAGDAENQSTSSCPALAAPLLTVGEGGAGPELSWTAVPDTAEYTVYRGDLGCDVQQVPIVTLATGVTTFNDTLPDPDIPRYYRVEAIGANGACHSPVSNCETTSAKPRLQMNGHRMLEEGSQVNFNGFPDPGEIVKIPATLFNGGGADALAVTGRLRAVDPSQGRVVTPLSPYPDMARGDGYESVQPHFELAIFDPGAACGEVVELEMEMNAQDAATRSNRFTLLLGSRDRDFVKTGSVSIPRQTPSPVTMTLAVADDRTIADLDVSVTISHPNAAELVVDLTSPGGTTLRLHENTGIGSLFTRYDLESSPAGPGTMADFNGESTAGTWTLSVSDTVWGTFGSASIQGFTLHVTADGGFDCEVLPCGEPVPTQAPDGLHVDKTIDGGDGSVDLDFSWTAVSGAAGYHVLHSTSALFDVSVDLTGRSDGPASLAVEDGAAITPGLSYFQVRAVNGCSQESP